MEKQDQLMCLANELVSGNGWVVDDLVKKFSNKFDDVDSLVIEGLRSGVFKMVSAIRVDENMICK